MADLSTSQLPPVSLPVQGADLIHVVRSGRDYQVSQANLVKQFLNALQDVNVTSLATGQTLLYNAVSGKWENSAIYWATVQGKPSTFAPSAHMHAWGDLTGVPASFTPEAHMHLWAEVTDKPTTFPPEAHTHDDRYFTETELSTPSGGGVVDWSNIINVPELGGGSGDMSKSVYDTDDDGQVEWADNALHANSADTASFAGSASSADSADIAIRALFLGTDGQLSNDATLGGSDPLGYYLTTQYAVKTYVDGKFALLSHTHLWAEITNKPTEFTPAAHRHGWADLDDVPESFPPDAHRHSWSDLDEVPAVGGDMDKATYDTDNDGKVEAADVADCVAWDGVTDRPLAFPPTLHRHAWSDLDSVPSEFTPSAHRHAWSNLDSVPPTFTPSAHRHSWWELDSVPASFMPSAHTHVGTDIYSLDLRCGSGITGDVHWTVANSPVTMGCDLYMHDLIIDAGVTVNPGGFIIYCSGTFTNNGLISVDGGAGGNGATGTGAGGAGGLPAYYGGPHTVFNPIAGAAGEGATAAAATNGTANVAPAALSVQGIMTMYAGGGGGGGAAHGTADGVTGLPSAPIVGARGGQGGAATGSGATARRGGGGGAGGGIIVIVAANIVNNGTISAKGGKGGNGVTSTDASGNGGGGGGGSIILAVKGGGTYVPGTLVVTGGAAGTGGAGGSAGANGWTWQVVLW